MEATKYYCPVVTNIKHKKIFNLRNLRKSLKFRPEIYRLILKMRLCVKKKSRLIKKLKHDYETAIGKTKVTAENKCRSTRTDVKTIERTTQTDETYVKKQLDNTDIKSSIKTTENLQSNSVAEDCDKRSSPGWIISDDAEKSIADQVKEVAQNVIEESGMVYVESAGMYYDYKTGYYYSPELGLYYHTDTGCYYYYSNENKTFVFHSYPDKSAQVPAPPNQIKKAKKHKKDENKSKRKRRKLAKNKMESKKESASKEDKDSKEEISNGKTTASEDKDENKEELEDGECSDSDNEVSDVDSDISTSTASDDETVSKHHPPCMRIIIRETNLPKLRVGSLYLITKDGGTIGREGEQHALVIKDHNVSRSHLDIRYDMDRKAYFAVDVGSKNGTILNGIRMSESTVTSQPLEVVHGSVIQLGETKLLCHVHPGTDTCGHCEPGLIMETEEKEKKAAYTRTCSVQRQHQLELARLKNLYAPAPLAIMDTEYNDRARARREQVGSSHSAEKTQASDIDTCIASENKGFKLLEKMGWSKGEGLGKDNQGDTEPIPLISNEGKTGLGATPIPTAAGRVSKTLGPATMRLASKTKMLKPPAKAFQQPAEEDSE